MTTREEAERKGGRYEIRVRGHLASCWSEWFGGLALQSDGPDETVVSGEVRDQADLHGVLARVRDLNLTLLAVRRLEATGEAIPSPRGESRGEASDESRGES